MKRLFSFSFILGIYIYLSVQITRQSGVALDNTSFVAGLSVAAFAGMTWFFLNGWWKTAGSPNRPQRVTIETKQTPNQVRRAALWAKVQIIVILGVIGLLIWLMGFSDIWAETP